MELGYEFDVYPLKNMDHLNASATLSYLEKSPPCHLFLDLGDQLKDAVYASFRTALLNSRREKDRLAASGSRQAVERYRKTLRERVLNALGGLPDSEGPLNAVVRGVVVQDGYRVEKVVFTSRPRVYVTGNLYVPDGLDAPTGAVLFVCGHAAQGKAFPEYQRVCWLLAKEGLVVLAMDSYGLGERYGYVNPRTNNQDVEWGCPEHDHVGAQLLMSGYAEARYFVHDAMRAIDYLAARPEVDAGCIGVTGNSGGGTLTALLMLLDDRVAAAAPGTFISSMEAILRSGAPQDAEQVWPGLAAAGFDHDDVLIAMAPKPVLLLATLYDYFPIVGTRETYASARRFYALYGREEALSLVSDAAEHSYSRKLAEAAAAFFCESLLGRPCESVRTPDAPLPEEELRCTATGQVRCEYPDAAFLFEEQLQCLDMALSRRRSLPPEELRTRALGWLRERVFWGRAFVEPLLRRFGRVIVEDCAAECMVFEYAEGLTANGLFFHLLENNGEPSRAVTVAVWENGTAELQRHRDFLFSRCRRGESVLVLDIPGYGAMRPNRILRMSGTGFEGTNYLLANDLFWLGDSLFSLRVFELLSAIRMLRESLSFDGPAIRLYGEGFPAVYTAAAALLTEVDLGGCLLRDYPRDMEQQAGDRLYDSYDIYSRLLPGALAYFDFSHLKTWVEEKYYEKENKKNETCG